ncbi:hypothetical protein HQ520_16855 [bacterium]|nr:hypothetical protein [bacterium]
MTDSPERARISPDYGGRFGYGFFHILVRLLGVTPAYVFLAFLIPYYVLFRPKARRAAMPYLNRRFPERGGIWRFFAAFVYFYKFGQVLIDQGAMGILGPGAFRVEFPDEEELYRRAGSGKGLVLLTSHVGAWQAAMVNMRALPVPVHFQFLRQGHTEGRHFFDLAGESAQFRIVDPTGFLGGMVQMTNALHAGECVSVMGDRAWGGRTLDSEFLREKAPFPIGGYHMALSTGADLVALLTVRTGKLAYRIESHYLTDALEAGLPRDEAQRALLARYIEKMEQYVDKHPFMWFNFFDFWAGGQENSRQ